jgi:hypothetical protein
VNETSYHEKDAMFEPNNPLYRIKRRPLPMEELVQMVDEEVGDYIYNETLKAIEDGNLYTIENNGKKYVSLWHGTSPANHKKILKSGKFLSGTYFGRDQETAKRYGGMHISRGEPVTMNVFVDIDKIYPSSDYFVSKEEVYYSNGLYEQDMNEGEYDSVWQKKD